MNEKVYVVNGNEYWQPEINVAQDECLIGLFSELEFDWETWNDWDFKTIFQAVKGKGLLRKLLAIILVPKGTQFCGTWTDEERKFRENEMALCPNSMAIPVFKDFFGSAGGWQGIFQNFMPGLSQPPEKVTKSRRRGKRG